MRSTSTLSLLLLSSTCTFALAAPPQLTFDSSLSGDDAFDIQGARNSIPLIIDDNDGEGTGHLSQWSKGVKHDFLAALESNSAQDWTLVMGNEGGDLDSMASALAWAYHLSHLDPPQKAVALLQTEQDALDLRPENQLALHYAAMASRHRDLLTMDELSVKPFALPGRIKGLALVDHNAPRAIWGNATIVSILDHHTDQGLAPNASPRLIQKTGSCSSLVAEVILDSLPSKGHPLREEGEMDPTLHGPLPVELVELLLRTIAIDTSALRNDSASEVDYRSAKRLMELSSWKRRDARKTMKLLNKDLSTSKKDLGVLDLRDLLRRDWKGDAVYTKSVKYPAITLGFASIPVSLEGQIERTPEKTTPEWFAVERAYTAEVGVDVSVVLTKYKNKDGEKIHEIALVVAHGWGSRLHAGSADRLFRQLKHGLESAPELQGPNGLQKWKRPDGKKLLPRRAVWTHTNDEAGRKVIRPIVERAAREWTG